MEEHLIKTIAEYSLTALTVFIFLHFGVKILFKFLDGRNPEGNMGNIKNIEDGIVQLQNSMVALIKLHEEYKIPDSINMLKNIKADVSKLETKVDTLKERGVEDKAILNSILKAIEHQTEVMDRHYKKQNGGA